MIVGVPREVKGDERRVAITPAGVTGLVAHGHEVRVESGAGIGSHFADEAYARAGASIVSVDEAWASAFVLKVKEPVASEYERLREGLLLFTYLHLAADERLTRELVERGVTALAYETLQLPDGSLPLLAPMSEVAGRLAVQAGAWCLQAENGGRGVLLGGASGVRPAKVVILGAGTAGSSACQVAVGVGAHVSILDVNPARLRYVHDILGGHLTTVMSNRGNIEEEVVSADLVIGAVLVPGARAPRLVSRELVAAMKSGAAIVDVAVDQGGCVETIRPTTHHDPIYLESGVVHYGVANMPGVVPNTSTHALTNATLSYAIELADRGLDAALEANEPLRAALNIRDGRIVHPAVAEAFGG